MIKTSVSKGATIYRKSLTYSEAQSRSHKI